MEDRGAVGVCMGILEFSLLKNYMQELLIAKKNMHVIFHFSMDDTLYNKFMISVDN